MVYTNMLFALLFDKWIFGTVPDAWSLVGSGLILGSAVYVAMQKGVEEVSSGPDIEVVTADEEMGMLQNMEEGESEREEIEETAPSVEGRPGVGHLSID